MVLGASGRSAVNVGVGTTAPKSRLQVGTPSNSYGEYLQIPIVTSTSPPPAADCTNPFAGRMVLQYDTTKKSLTTLWSCSPAGVRTKLASGG